MSRPLLPDDFIPVSSPAAAAIQSPMFSGDGRRIAYLQRHGGPDTLALFVFDRDSGQTTRRLAAESLAPQLPRVIARVRAWLDLDADPAAIHAVLGADFPALVLPDGRCWHYLDTAATAQKPRPVIDAITRAYDTTYATVHRGVYARSADMTLAYEAARQKVARIFLPWLITFCCSISLVNRM